MVSVNNSSRVNYNNNSGGDLPLISPAELRKVSTQKTYRQDDIKLQGLNNAVSEVTQYGVGALSGYKYQANVITASHDLGNTLLTGSFKDVIGSFKSNGQLVGMDAANAAGVGALLSGGVSVIGNTVSLLKGRESLRSAGSDVVTDTIKGAMSGVGGLAVGGVSALALGAMKVTGTPVVIASVIGGAIGASLINRLFRTENIREALKGQ